MRKLTLALVALAILTGTAPPAAGGGPRARAAMASPEAQRIRDALDAGGGTLSVRTLRPMTSGITRRVWERPEPREQRLALAPADAAAAMNAATPHSGAAARQPVVIDLMFAYTQRAAGYYAEIERDLLALAVEEANNSFLLSNLGHIELRMVHAYQTDYTEHGAVHFDHVWRLADKGDGYLEEVHTLRDEHRADVVILLVDDPSGCGLATRVAADADEAFAVVHHECAAASYAVAHEIGHLIGARHELSYANGTWRDIMGYKESCGGCPRVPVWSSPTVRVGGEPAGTAVLDNARIIAERAWRVAAFR
jgi:hypothetical protein